MNKEKEMEFDLEQESENAQHKQSRLKKITTKKPETEEQRLTKEANKNRNEAISTELLFELLKQYAWLSSAIIGAIILLVQLKVVPVDGTIYRTVGFLILSIFFALIGKDSIVDALLSGKTIYDVSTYMKVLRYLSMTTLGLGVGVFIGGIIFA